MIPAEVELRSPSRLSVAARVTVGPAIVLTVLCAALFRLYQYDIGPDTISYLTIAQHYAAGRWEEALNVSWSPFFSWILAPLLKVGFPVLAGARVVCWISGLLSLFGTALMCETFGLSGRIRSWVMYTAALMTVAFVLLKNGPDLLLTAILLFYFAIVFGKSYPQNRWAGVACGALCALGYLTKAYAFFFFLLNFTVLSGVHWSLAKGIDRRRVLLHYVAGMLALLILSSPWIMAISSRTGKPSLGSTGAWNYRLVGPDSPGYPQYFHLIPPAREHGISMWEEQSPDLLPSWKPYGSVPEIKHQLRVIGTNLKYLRGFVLDTSLLGFAILLCYPVLAIGHLEKGRPFWLFPILTILTYCSGYLLVIIQDRYIWSALLLMTIMGAVCVQQWTRSLRPIAGALLLIGFCASFAFLPLRMLVSYRRAGEIIWRQAEAIRREFPVHGRLASCGEWNDSLALAFFLGQPYYGSTAATVDEQSITRMLNPSIVSMPQDAQQMGTADQEIAENRVAYYLAWSSCQAIPASVSSKQEITMGRLPGLKIYRLSGM